MATCEVRLKRRVEVAEGTLAFHFERPEDFRYKPGQAIDVVLKGPPDRAAGDTRHTFSLVSAPFEDELAVATRMRDSAFKRALQALPIGSVVGLEGPFGSLTLHNDRSRAAVFVAGGIGVTPFISIVRQAAHDQLSQRLVLLLSNRRPEDAAFLDELQRLERDNGSFRLIATMTQIGDSGRSWQGLTGTIDEGLIKRISDGLSAPIYYVAGPPAMVEGVKQTLNNAGVDDDDIRTEQFYGY